MPSATEAATSATSSTTTSSNKKWKSLFQLNSSNRRRGSSNAGFDDDNGKRSVDEPNDELQDDDLFLTSKSKCNSTRRPSAPAILVDLKNFLTKSVGGRRSSSTYGLCSNSRDNVNIPSGLFCLSMIHIWGIII